jgi:hypothetical protein
MESFILHSKDKKVQGCDATKFNSSSSARLKKIQFNPYVVQPQNHSIEV